MVYVSETPEIGALESLALPAQPFQQPCSCLDRVGVKPPVGFTIAGVLEFPATADALKKDDVHTPHPVSISTVEGMPFSQGDRCGCAIEFFRFLIQFVCQPWLDPGHYHHAG